MKEEWLFHGAVVPIDVETTAALVAEIKRLIDVIGGMALAQPEQEPVAWEQFYPDFGKPQIAINPETVGYVAPQRTWVGLTDEERDEICLGDESVARSIEAKLRKKNGGNHES